MSTLRIGYVPEHFSTPLHFAQKHYDLDAQLIPYPSGTGHMITALRAGEIDVGIGLTEAWVAGLGKAGPSDDGGYRLVGTYVESPLRWAISVGAGDISSHIASVDDLAGSKLGVSRLGSGSHVMGQVLADTHRWPSYSSIVPLNTFRELREGVNRGTADFFMWEHFTTKRYWDNGEVRRLGDTYTPWSSWKMVASTDTLKREAALDDLFAKLDRGIEHFERNQEETVAWIAGNLDYSVEDAREWMATVEYARGTRGVRRSVVEGCVDALRRAGVLEGGASPEAMIHYSRD